MEEATAPAATPSRVTTVIPVHRTSLTELEAQRVGITIRNAGSDRTSFIAPTGIDLGWYSSHWPGIRVERSPDEHFASVDAYSRWLLGTDLYRRFEDSDFILVCQTDAVLLRPLPVHETWEFDYLGAVWARPWTVGWDPFRRRLTEGRLTLRRRTLRVGNGGLSLRRTSAFADMPMLREFREPLNEDVTISYCHQRLGLRIAEPEAARRFFIETEAKSWREGDPVPDVLGYHGLDRHNPTLEAVLLARHGGA